MMRSARWGRRRGFTLVELLVVVAMVGVLAALAILGYRKYINSAHSSEAQGIIQGIRAGEEAYKAETLSYLTCSTTGIGGATYYPQTSGSPSSTRWNWNQQGHTEWPQWSQLNVTADAPVRFGYQVVAGAPGVGMPAIPAVFSAAAFPANPNPWYVVMATGTPDPNGVTYYFMASSLSGEVWSAEQ